MLCVMDASTHGRLTYWAVDTAWRDAMATPDLTLAHRDGYQPPPLIGGHRPDALMRYGQSDTVVEALTADDLGDPDLISKLEGFLGHVSPDGEPAALKLVVVPGEKDRAQALADELDPRKLRIIVRAIEV
jgi:hypothetical protein